MEVSALAPFSKVTEEPLLPQADSPERQANPQFWAIPGHRLLARKKWFQALSGVCCACFSDSAFLEKWKQGMEVRCAGEKKSFMNANTLVMKLIYLENCAALVVCYISVIAKCETDAVCTASVTTLYRYIKTAGF
ncbi:MAG: hypothetical protein Q7J24_07770 [Desulfomicrobium sp.]|nr:hypothetical protein [Desulfomicrobium sp.]